jgi:hypothetical protein
MRRSFQEKNQKTRHKIRLASGVRINNRGRASYTRELTSFDTPRNTTRAAMVYDREAQKYVSKFASLNFSKIGERSGLTGKIMTEAA